MHSDIYILTGGMFLAFATGAYLMRSLRRRRKPLDAPSPMIFDLAEMQAMRAAGLITPDEFDRLREIVLKRQTEPNRASDRGHGFEVLPSRDIPGSRDDIDQLPKTE